ncbi:MAG: hypothetical protein WCY84_03615, partial [Candidatus Cloacimonadaceae bacterium]
SSFYWDFDGDGITDSTEENPVWSYAQSGRYDVSLRVVTGNLEDYSLYPQHILVQETLLKAPQNLSLQALPEQSILLNWDAVSEDIDGNPAIPTNYLVYRSSTPKGLFKYEGSTEGECEYLHLGALQQKRNFYFVIAFVGSRSDLEDFLRYGAEIEILPEGGFRKIEKPINEKLRQVKP